MNEVQAVLQKLDPDKCYEDRLLLQAKVFSVSLEIISEDKSEITTPTSLLLEQMNKIGVFRSGRHCTTLNILFYKLVVIGSNYNYYKHKL